MTTRTMRWCVIALMLGYAGIDTPSVAVGQTVGGADSLTVANVHRVIRESSPDLEARRAALAAAETRVRAAGALPPAVLSSELEEIPDGLDVTEAGSFRLDVSRELPGGGRRLASRALAEEEARTARLELALGQQVLLVHVSELLIGYVGALAISERLEAQDSLFAGTEDALTVRFASGESRYVEVLRLRAERLRTRAAIAESRSEAHRMREELVGLVGLSDTGVARLSADLDKLALRAPAVVNAVRFPPAAPLDSLVAISPAVQRAEAKLREAEAALRLTRAGQGARLSGSVGIQRFGSEDGGHRVGPTIGASMTLPFTARGAGLANEAAAERETQSARARHRAALAQTRAAMRAAKDRYETAVNNAGLFQAALMRGAREERENALASYRGGTLSLLELLDFERALAMAETSHQRSRIEAARAFADLLSGAANLSGHAPRAAGRQEGDS